MSNSQDISGFVTQNVWRPKLIKLTAASSKAGVGGTATYIDPTSISHIRRLPIDPEGTLQEDVTYVYTHNTGLYVRESPEEVAALREKAMDGK